ncbi:MAG: SRPBCC family protein [Burkholderiales bacterium]
MFVTFARRDPPARAAWTTLALSLLLAASAAASAQSPIRSIDVVEKDDGYVANLVMFAPVPTTVAWDVLTDFDKMAGWVPNVRESKVLARDGNVLEIEQRGVAKFGIASFPYVSTRKMVLDPPRTVQATQIKGNMKRLQSLMTVAADGNGTQLKYRLELVPSGLAAAALSADFLKHELTEQFTAIVGEMVRRAK